MESSAAVLHEPGDLGPDGPARIETIDVAEPTGEEVLVRIEAASLCHTDVASALGHTDESKPFVMGHEGAGVVEAVGEDVTQVAPGDHVVIGRIACGRCRRCREGRSNLCQARIDADGSLRTGHRRFHGADGTEYAHYHGASTFTEYSLVTEEVAVPITEEVPMEQAPLLGCGVFTGFGAVTTTAGVRPGDSVAIFGAGGVGLSGVQGARLCGATDIVVVDIRTDTFDVARDLGATHTVDSSVQDPSEDIHDLTREGVDYAFDMVGNPRVVEQAVRSLAPTGSAVLVGTPPGQLEELELSLRSLVRYERSIVGSFNGSANLPLAIPVLADLVASGHLALEPMITNSAPLEDVNLAMERLETGSEIRQVLFP